MLANCRHHTWGSLGNTSWGALGAVCCPLFRVRSLLTIQTPGGIRGSHAGQNARFTLRRSLAGNTSRTWGAVCAPCPSRSLPHNLDTGWHPGMHAGQECRVHREIPWRHPGAHGVQFGPLSQRSLPHNPRHRVASGMHAGQLHRHHTWGSLGGNTPGAHWVQFVAPCSE